MGNVIELADQSTTRACVAAEVRAEIGRAGVSQLAVARATGIPQSTLNRKLAAKAERDSFTVDELDRIARVLQVPIGSFFASADRRGPDGPGGSDTSRKQTELMQYRWSVGVG